MQPDDLTPEEHESYEERAAIMQYQGLMTKEQSEEQAMAIQEKLHDDWAKETVEKHFPNDAKVKAALTRQEELHGKAFADDLRARCRKWWKEAMDNRESGLRSHGD